MSGSQRMNRNRLMVFKRFTLDMATLSKCTDKGNACIITDATGSQVYAIGINGGAKGGHDCLCKLDESRYTCVHAEANALAKNTSTDPNKCVICTMAPCVTCAALMVNNGVKQLYYVNKYKSEAGIQILKDAGVYVEDISDKHVQEVWVDNLIDILDVNGFTKLTTPGVLGKWDAVAQEAIIEAARNRNRDTVITTLPDGLLIEWRCISNG